MYDRNVKPERILTKFRVLVYEYICDRNAKFHKKILFITRVINIQILTTKYISFQYSVTYSSQALRRPAHRARETVHLLTHETPDFITPALWPDLGEDAGGCVPQPDSWHRSAEVAPGRMPPFFQDSGLWWHVSTYLLT